MTPVEQYDRATAVARACAAELGQTCPRCARGFRAARRRLELSLTANVALSIGVVIMLWGLIALTAAVPDLAPAVSFDTYQLPTK